MKISICVFVLSVLCTGMAQATPGGVDANGCHDSKKIGFHCHAQRAGARNAGGSGESVSVRDKRLRRECKTMRNAGACLGYGVGSSGK